MAESKDPNSKPGPEPVSEDRFRYIGFNVFPGQAPEFWKDDSERKSHTDKVRETGGRFVPLSRSNSMVAARAISAFERWTLAVSSALLAASPFFPWFSFTRGSESFSYSGASLLLSLGPVREFLALGPGLLGTSFLLLLALMIISSVLGVVALYSLITFGAGSSEGQLSRLHRIMMWHYLPIVGWAAFFGMAILPTELPFGLSLGLSEVSHEYGMGALAASASVGLWIPMGALWVNAIKGNDL